MNSKKVSKNELKPLYIQIRSDEVTKDEEFAEFVRYSGIPIENFTVVNVFNEPRFDAGRLDDHDLLFVGGTSDDNDDVSPPPILLEPSESTARVLKGALDANLPTLASCFGFQVAIVHLGGELVYDPAKMEMGSYDLCLTDEAKSDPIFCDTPNPFHAISGHKKRASKLPEGAVLLAYSDLCPIHAMRIGDNFYATQFHPELDDRDLVARITRYQERYPLGDNGLQNIIDTIKPTPDSNALLKKFVEHIVLG